MADRRAMNKYYPPDWDPSKGSINKHKNSHPLRDRARKIKEGILVVRFEMPFNIWCLGCEKHIGMGVRYNAEKSKVGNYYTSPIYEFKMKCHLCDNFIVIKTDPSKFDYVIVEGARKQVLSGGVTDGQSASIEDGDLCYQSAWDRAEEAKKRLTNSMYKLEKIVEDKINSERDAPNLAELRKLSDMRWKDSFAANQLIRAEFRRKRKSRELAKQRDKRVLKRTSLKISLVECTPSDTIKAKEMIKNSQSSRLHQDEARKRNEILGATKFIQRVTRSSKNSLASSITPSCSRSRVQKITNFQ